MIFVRRDYARLRNAVLFASGLAWAILLMMPGPSCHGLAMDFGTSLRGSWEALASRTSGWFLMLIAMMAPMTTHALYQIHLAGFSAGKWRLSALFALGYGLVWMGAGFILNTIDLTVKWWAKESLAPALALAAIAAIWQISPYKQVCLNQCQRHDIPPAFGAAADWGALRAGLGHGQWCFGSCWAAMLLPLFIPNAHMAAMFAVTVLMFCERLDPPARPEWRLRGFRTAFRIWQLRILGPRSSRPPYSVASPN